MTAKNRSKEIPYQDFSKIREAISRKKENQIDLNSSDLFVDPSFPPDWSSLTYVYSGDDKYEKTVFKRPINIINNPVLVGVGGVCVEWFPWKSWKQKSWFQGAVMVVSLSLKFMEKIIPGYRNFEQGFEHKYLGAFRFHIWRFGEWIEVVVDDYLPILNDMYLFCSSMGQPQEFWGALIEKAYAKCKKTFQAIEYGNILDALTDLTGGICEFYTPDVNPHENLYHIMYKSSLNRSMMVCWRNNKRLTESAFDFDDFQKDNDKDCCEDKRFLHIITAVTKEKFRPLSRKEDDEFWMTMEDFRCNYGGLFIISSEEPYTTDWLKLDRRFRQENGVFTNESTTENRTTSVINLSGQNRYKVERDARDFTPHPISNPSCFSFRQPSSALGCMDTETVQSQSICVREALRSRTVDYSHRIPTSNDQTPKNLNLSSDNPCGRVVCPNSYSWLRNSSKDDKESRLMNSKAKSDRKGQRHSNDMTSAKTVNVSSKGRDFVRRTSETESLLYQVSKRSMDVKLRREKSMNSNSMETDSLASLPGCIDIEGEGQIWANRNCSTLSNTTVMSEQSTYSASEISLQFQTPQPTDESHRPKSAPSSSRNNSDTSLASLTQSHFLANKTDYFKQPGRWKVMFEHKFKWTKDRQGISRSDMDRHSRSPRILFTVSRTNEVLDPNLVPRMQGKRHVIISVLQDYRHGPSTANSLLFPIGFCLYRAKNIDKDDKRHLSKLHLVSQVDGPAEIREVNARFDLEPGGYVLVPYCLTECHEGEFLVRILAEWKPPGGAEWSLTQQIKQ
ncbi:hypothetical protein LOTGIDRAFT_169536 [Lottia gigantea]|uniref:Calpain catalytic domain-containing protein n=1 Tax=Lottia gigantea TaxID=225164 RepID=V4B3Z9_LOTGI|nr:hypothetical protein LOTGIDRAFT_169536 [Lottia gigantea]ESO83134.1 hypothetical protein LOTGIDRAFT_169536 [Lottia gigantea]